MKRTLALALALSLLGGAVAMAHQPGITIDAIGNLQYASFPQDYTVTGTVLHEEDVSGPQDNVCALNALQVIVNDGSDDVTILNQGNPANFFGWSCALTVAAWSATWSIPGPGNYTITAKVKHVSEEGEATESVSVTTLTVDYPAAPAVAAKLLHDAGVNPRYGQGKDGGNCISNVALHMGPGTDFDGEEKSDVAAYEAAVRAFLNGSGNDCTVGA
jgi:hypothetical protein